jgi:hypothetical protein
MLFTVLEAQAGLLFICGILMTFLSVKYIYSEIPRLRVILLCGFCLIFWFISMCFSVLYSSHAHILLWNTLNVLTMAATLFMLFIAIYEVLTNQG